MTKQPWNKNKSIGQKIEYRRKQLGFSQPKLGAMIGSKKQYVSDLEKSSKRPSAEKIFRLAAALQAPMSYFLDENCHKVNDVDEEVLLTEFRKIKDKKLAIKLVRVINECNK